jgi:NADPH:quinone reductase-like Zn-dependent oxidoreductase
VIHAVYDLDGIAEAERELEERRHFGKIVIQIKE